MELDFGKADISLVNVVRRIILRDIYTYAIEKVTILTNTSVMHDEMLADRLALVPLRITCNGTRSDKIDLSMSVSCESGTKNVYSRDILYSISRDVNVEVVYPDILLAVLKEGQSIDIRAECIRGNGEKHYKFSPVTTIDVMKEGDNVKLYAELIGQLTKDEILTTVKERLLDVTARVCSAIDRSM